MRAKILLLLLCLLPLPAVAQTAVQWGLNSGILCVYDSSASRPCVGIGTLDSTSHTFTYAGPANITALTVSSSAALPAGTTIGSNPAAFSSGTLTNGHCVSINSMGAFVDAGGTCTTGGGGGTVSSGTVGQLPVYTGTTTVSSFALAGDCTFSNPNIVCTKLNGKAVSLGGTMTTASTFETDSSFLARSSVLFSGSVLTTGSFYTGSTFSTNGSFSTSASFQTIGTFATNGAFQTNGAFYTGGAFSTAGPFSVTGGINSVALTTTGATTLTLPTTGTLATTANINTALPSTPACNLYGGTGGAGAAQAVTIGSGLNCSGNNITTAAAATIPTNTILGNYSGSTAIPTATSDMVGFRNRIVNGDDSIDQRNNFAAQSIAAYTSGPLNYAFTDDHFFVYATGAAVTGQNIARGTTGLRSYQIAYSGSVSQFYRCQRIVSGSSADLAGTTITLSALLADTTGNAVSWSMDYANALNNFTSVTHIGGGTLAASTTSSLTRSSVSVSIPSAAINGIQVCLSEGVSGSGIFTTGDWQLEAGAYATNFERLPPQIKLQLAERYFQVSYDVSTSISATTLNGAPTHVVEAASNFPSIQIFFRSKMAADPTVTLYSPGTGTSGKIYNGNTSSDVPAYTAAVGMSGMTAVVNNTSVSPGSALSVHWTAQAEF